MSVNLINPQDAKDNCCCLQKDEKSDFNNFNFTKA